MPDSSRYIRIGYEVEDTTVTLPQNLLTNAGTLFEDFETIGDWTATEGSVADDAVNFKTGAHSIAITAASGASGRAHKTVNWDMSSFGRGMCYFKLDAMGWGDTPSIYFSSDGGFSNYIRYKLTYTALVSLGWDVMHFHEDSMINDGGSPDLANIIRFRCRQVAQSGETPTVNFDSLYLNMMGVPAIAFLFEDIRNEHYDCAAYMASHGMRGTFSVISDLAAGVDPDRIHWAQLIEMEAAGHCLINATKDHTALGTLTEAQQETELTACRDAGIAAGIWAGAAANNWRYMSYPLGSYNADTLTAFDNVGMRIGLNEVSSDGLFGMPFGQKYMLPMRHLSIATNLSTITGWIDNAIARGQLLIFYLEDLGGLSISLETFEDVIDYLVTRKNDIYSVTFDDLYKLQSGSIVVPRAY